MPTAVITGATQGIGKAIAEKLLHEGFSIFVCARTESDLKAQEAVWNEQFPAASIFTATADLSIKQDVLTFAQFVLSHTNQIDILVNNAGIFFPGSIAQEPDGNLETLMQVNVYSAYHLTRQLLPAMLEHQQGHIFNICSIASLKAYEHGGSYSITKYALLGFSDNLRQELMEDGIKVTAIMPGATWSRSWSGSGVAPDRIMKAEDVAEAVWMSYNLSASAVVEHLVLRPQLGDL